MRSISFFAIPPAAFLLGIAALLAGCAGTDKEQDPTSGWSAQQLYDAARESADNRDFEQAIDYYKKLEARYPFGPLAQQAQVDLIHAHYRNEEPQVAIAAAEHFIKLHPRHPNVDYAYYMKGMAYFSGESSFVEKIYPLDKTERDMSSALDAFRSFEELIQRFPGSRYAADARQRMVYLKNTLAAREAHIARYYLRRGAWLAAANRARYVVENYQGTPAMPDALSVMVEAYRRLELRGLSEDALRVLTLNYPERAASYR
ncbi:MAG: outer membrane protein assembly factor BamD [Ectothiorhodospiraceae bacterium AqS1]|nr:outer membrane protein assembly factor BamD [Ectothiorhodospiraceae bacterium AqS1]